ncbi:MAG: BREX-3 system P-loop-containing protein BrxF [Thomasclavelia spiroformis]
MNQLKDAIEKAKENENKLILIVGLPGSGKSKSIHEYSKDSGIPILDLDNIFKDTTNNIAEVMDNFLVTYNKDVLLLDNKKILYAKDSNIDMLSFLKNLAEKLIVVATWNGKVDNNKLIHIRSKLPTDLTYSLDNEQLTIIQKS